MAFLIVLCALAISSATATSHVHHLESALKQALVQERVINGSEAVPHSAPYTISLRKSSTSGHICGGTIIGKEWIVTAAHCFKNPMGLVVIAGLHVLYQLDESTQQRVVDFGKRYELFNDEVGPYDIAILHVDEPFVFNEYVQPASLPAHQEIPVGNATIYGWGQTEAFNFSMADNLQTVQTQVMDWVTCEEFMPNSTALHETNICSDSLYIGISACNGDSGGPLVKDIENGPAELIGIVSWGNLPCGYLNWPSVYTRVSAYIDWIAEVINAYYILH